MPDGSGSGPTVGIVVLNWHGARDTAACVASLQRLTYQNVRTLVVDNASNPTDVQWLTEHLGSNVEVLRAPENLGYAGGNNLGMAHLRDGYRPDFYWILNNDVTVEPDSLSALVRYALAHPRAGAVGSTVLNASTGRVYCLGGGRLNLWTGFDRLTDAGKVRATANPPSRLDYVAGAAMLLSRSALEATGGFDTEYFLYSEEADLCERLRRTGFSLGYAPDSTVHHGVARSTGYHSATYVYYFLRGKLRFERKWARPWHWVTFIPSFFALYIGGFLWRAARAGRPLPIGPIVRAVADSVRGRWGRRLLHAEDVRRNP